MPAYVIGGFVRDKLLGRPTKDADIVCVGDGIQLAHKVAERFQPKPAVAFFKTYGTAQIKLKHFYEEDHKHLTAENNGEEDQIALDSPATGELVPTSRDGEAIVETHEKATLEIEFVGARKESYRYH